LSEIARLKQNNDVMRAKLLTAIAERDHYQAALKQHGIDPGPMPAAAPTTAAPSAAQNASSPEPTAAGSSTPSSDVGDGGS
jgi:hypothetical protein